MNNSELCMALMRADTVEEVRATLSKAGLWDDLTNWRPFNDDENNYSTIGNQQSEGIAALVEKIVNGVDARLVNACLAAGVDPESVEAPQTMVEAVARFFETGPKKPSSAGRVSEWENSEATKQGRLLTVAATGNMAKEGNPSLTIADQGEGQTPDKVPLTFMSLAKSNKLRIPFVQGKFNMGGTGALLFSGGDAGLQLIVTRRNPSLLGPTATARDLEWSFSVVRREDPRNGARSSIYTYLAPVGAADGTAGSVLSFAADAWPIFPEADENVRDAYARGSQYGSLVKLYEYEWRGSKSNIVLSGNGLLRRIDVGLPELALPVRLFECRPGYKGDAQSYSTNALGVVSRLDRDRANNLENEAVIGAGLTIAGTQVPVRIYVFKAGRAEQYKNASQGVIYSVNGQTHAMHGIDFFRRKAVNLKYLADSLLVVVDCSAIQGRMREDIFMNSRDRLRDRRDARELETAIEQLLRSDPTLKELSNRRRAESLQNKLTDDKPLADVLQGLFKSSPMLSKLLLSGFQLSAPFPPSGGNKKGGNSIEFVGKRFPTFFRPKGHSDESVLSRVVGMGSSARITFETDAENDYFTRVDEPGAINVALESSTQDLDEEIKWSWNGPKDGILHLTVALPDNFVVADQFVARVEVADPIRIAAFTTDLDITVVPASGGGGGGKRNPPAVDVAGDGSGGGAGSTFALPNIVPVHKADWQLHGFTEDSALAVVSSEEDGGTSTNDFFINVDNKYLRILQKESKADPNLLEKQFTYGFVILGLAMLQDITRHANAADGTERDAEQETREVSRAIAPVLVPMLQSIGDLSEGDFA